MSRVPAILFAFVLFAVAVHGDEPHSTATDRGTITAADWSTYNYDARGWRFNHAEDQLTPDNASGLELQWQFPPKGSDEIVGAINATPSVVEGFVYFGTSTHPMFYKLSPDGKVVWKFQPGGTGRQMLQVAQRAAGLVPRDGIYSSALVTETSVYFGDVVGVAYCLDRQTGKLRWSLDTQAASFPGAHHANLLMASPIVAGELIVFAGGAYEHAAAATPGYECCYGRGMVMAVDPDSGRLVWKYDVGPPPEKFDPPLKIQTPLGERVFHYGPSTSSVWSTPSYDPETQTIFFGTDVHNSPRQPTEDDPRSYSIYSAAVIAVDAKTGREKWVTQTNPNDLFNLTLPAYDPASGYKDQSVGDTPKILEIRIDGKQERVVGAGSKSGGFYVMRLSDGELLAQTPVYQGPPSDSPDVDPRTLALPGVIGGLQTGCATDGQSIYTNGNDNVWKGSVERPTAPPTAGRVTSISTDTKTENWRHERPKVARVGGTPDNPLFRNCGDPVSSGIALGGGCAAFTTFTSNRLVVLDASSGEVLKEIRLGPVLAGPSISRGRIYIGTGNTQFAENPSEAYFPKSTRGTLYCFGVP